MTSLPYIRHFTIQYYKEAFENFLSAMSALFPHLIATFKVSVIHGKANGGVFIHEIINKDQPTMEYLLEELNKVLYHKEGIVKAEDILNELHIKHDQKQIEQNEILIIFVGSQLQRMDRESGPVHATPLPNAMFIFNDQRHFDEVKDVVDAILDTTFANIHGVDEFIQEHFCHYSNQYDVENFLPGSVIDNYDFQLFSNIFK